MTVTAGPRGWSFARAIFNAVDSAFIRRDYAVPAATLVATVSAISVFRAAIGGDPLDGEPLGPRSAIVTVTIAVTARGWPSAPRLRPLLYFSQDGGPSDDCPPSSTVNGFGNK